VRLDAQTVAELELTDGKTDQIFFDDDLSGFGFRIRAGGKRSFICQYRVAGRTRRQTIGTRVSADQARKQAWRILAAVECGADPQADKAKARLKAAQTVEAIVGKYLAAKENASRPATHRAARAYLSGSHFKPLHPIAIADVTLQDVATCLTTIVADRGTATAGQARSHLSRLFAWAMGEGLCSENPVLASNKPEGAAQQRERVLRGDFELAAIWNAASGAGDYDRIVKLLMLTGCRREEIGGLRWDEVDLPKAVIRLPKERCKNGHAHIIALTEPAIEILTEARQEQGVDRVFVFGAGGAAGFSRWAHGKRGLDARLAAAGVAPWRLHDLRRTMATSMGEQLGIQPHIVEATLNHWQGNAYNWATYENDKRSAWVRWTEHVTALAAGKSPKVVPLKIA
jgi:integrase